MINFDELKKVDIDYEAGLTRFMNDPGFYYAVLDAFVHSDILQRAQVCYKTNDREQLAKVVHEAKGASGNTGLDNLYDKSCSIVSLLRSAEYTDEQLKETFERFEEEFTKTYNGIKAALSIE